MNYRRLRSNPWIRNLVKEVRVSTEQLMQPLFAVEGLRDRQLINGLTGVYRDTSESLLKQIEMDLENGVHSFLLFSDPLFSVLTASSPPFSQPLTNGNPLTGS